MKVTARIKPNMKHREEVVSEKNGEVTVYTKAPAIEGRANQAAERLLAAHYGVSKTQVELIRGHASKLKVFEIKP